jgi:hypothetical protein
MTGALVGRTAPRGVPPRPAVTAGDRCARPARRAGCGATHARATRCYPRHDYAELPRPLIVLGFLGRLIAPGRGVVIYQSAGHIAPATVGVGGLALTVGLSLRHLRMGMRVAGAGLPALGAWLAIHNVARPTIRQRGLPRHMANCLLAGDGRPADAGVLWLRFGTVPDGPPQPKHLRPLANISTRGTQP